MPGSATDADVALFSLLRIPINEINLLAGELAMVLQDPKAQASVRASALNLEHQSQGDGQAIDSLAVSSPYRCIRGLASLDEGIAGLIATNIDFPMSPADMEFLERGLAVGQRLDQILSRESALVLNGNTPSVIPDSEVIAAFAGDPFEYTARDTGCLSPLRSLATATGSSIVTAAHTSSASASAAAGALKFLASVKSMFRINLVVLAHAYRADLVR